MTMNKWGSRYLPLCIFTIINFLVWRKSVEVKIDVLYQDLCDLFSILRSWEAPPHLQWKHIQKWSKVMTYHSSHSILLRLKNMSKCKQDPLVEKMTTVSRIPPVVLTARSAASSPTTRTLASWRSTNTSLQYSLHLSACNTIIYYGATQTGLTGSTSWSSVRNGEENSGWNSIIPPDVQTDGEVLQDQAFSWERMDWRTFCWNFFLLNWLSLF